MIEKEPRYQVILELSGGKTMPLGPIAPRNFCEHVCEGINRNLIKGKRSPLNVKSASFAPITTI